MCSTPCDITDEETFIIPHSFVLNAFRHHGWRDAGYPGQVGGHPTVLNAFRHHGWRDRV